jgi:hypothetical protein
MGNQTCDLPACNVVPQPIALPHVPQIHLQKIMKIN